MNIQRKSGMEPMVLRENAGVSYLAFPALEASGLFVNAFSTRMGGVSEGPFATMNFSGTRGDNPEHVHENYLRMAKALNTDISSMVVSYQTHTTNVRLVTENDRGKGVVRERDYRDVDGLICNIPGITLVTFYADCVPPYFADPVNRAVGLSHSGWRGTVARMGRVTVGAMQEAFGTKPEDLTVCIGPSICKGCYEVGEDVAKEFQAAFLPEQEPEILEKKKNGKYLLDLWRANEIILRESGIKPENIHVTDICTCCNPEFLFSHRKTGEARGNLAAFLGIR